MKKLIMISMFLTVFTTIPLTNSYAASCEEKADACFEKCEERWTTDDMTWWDGAGRIFCKSGCSVAETGCIVKERVS